MPVAFPSKDYDAEQVLRLLQQFETTLVEKSFTSIQTYSDAIDDFTKKNVIPDLEPFFRTITQNIQMFFNESDGSIVGIHEGLRAVIDQLERVSLKIQDNFMPFVQGGSFLVHGDSELLANVLVDCLIHNQGVDILILEGLPQNSGVALLKRLKESTAVKSNPEYLKRLLLAPDSSALRLLQRRKCNFVLFGAHAVTPHGCLVNSAGSLQLATLAKESNVAVYSLCPTFKFYLSMQRMPFSSDDLEVLGSKLSSTNSSAAGAVGGAVGVGISHRGASSSSQGSSPTHVNSRTGTTVNFSAASISKLEGDLPLVASSSSSATQSNTVLATAITTHTTTMMGAPAHSGNSERLSRNSPSLQLQQQQQSLLSNASFSAPPPSLQISPQLNPAIGSNSLSLVAAAASANLPLAALPRPQQPPFGNSNGNSNANDHFHYNVVSTPPSCAGGDDQQQQQQQYNNNNNNNNNNNSSSNNNNGTNGNNLAVGNILTTLSQLHSYPSHNNYGAPNSLPKISPVLCATSPLHALSGDHPTTTSMTSAGPSRTYVNTPQHNSGDLLATHFAPNCAFQLDLVGADKITHFFTEHGVVMPWSVADKISKIFLKEIQNKRKVNRVGANY